MKRRRRFIEGDFDPKDSPFHFPGKLVVKGDVPDKVETQTNDGVEIDGIVGAAVIRTNGDIDIFELLAIEKETGSEWMMFLGEDLAARVQRKSDGVAFHLGLAEIETVERGSLNHQLLYDYAVWFVNNR